MNKYIKLYVTLFLASMILSSTVLVAFAKDERTADTLVTYEQPAGENPGAVYEIKFPTTQKFHYGDRQVSLSFSIVGMNDLPAGYVVYVDIDKSTFADTGEACKQYFKLTCTTGDFYRMNTLSRSDNNERLYFTSYDDNYLNIATFRNSGFDSETKSLYINYSEDNSTDTKNNAGGTYQGTLHFKVHGEQTN